MNDSASRTHAEAPQQLAAALRSGIHRVILEQEHLNTINVFPVADGDTGTNLSLSLSASLPALEVSDATPLHRLLANIADLLLDGARGNSGAIMAQFFQGLSDAAEELKEFGLRSVANVVTRGSEYAHDAIADPKPGTILSVIASFAKSLADQSESGIGIGRAFRQALAAAQEALIRTETELEVLRKAGVVDAGARGFVVMVEGIYDHLVDNKPTERPALVDMLATAADAPMPGDELDLQFRYCTECMISGAEINRRKLREALSGLGNSLVIAGTSRKAKVHIHVNEPASVFELARRYGTISGEKADDMQRQQHTSHSNTEQFAVITDTAADISEEDMERLDIHVVPLRVQFGDRGYLDKISITGEAFYDELRNSPVAPTSSQPSPGDFRRQYQFLASHFADVVSLNLTGTVSGTLQAAETAAGRVNARGKIHVVNTLNASTGQGLLAVFAAECAANGKSVAATLEAIRELIPHTLTFALVDDLSYAVRGGRVPRWAKTIADTLHLTPVLRTTPDGRVVPGGVLPGRKNSLRHFARFVAAHVDKNRPVRVGIGHAICEDKALELQSLLTARLPNLERCSIAEMGAAIGVHCGPGSLVIGIMPGANS